MRLIETPSAFSSYPEHRTAGCGSSAAAKLQPSRHARHILAASSTVHLSEIKTPDVRGAHHSTTEIAARKRLAQKNTPVFASFQTHAAATTTQPSKGHFTRS